MKLQFRVGALILTAFTLVRGLTAATSPANTTMTLPGVFGPGWTVDSLANLEIGRFTGRMVDYRFRSNHTGTLDAVNLFFIFKTYCGNCYADGNGGSVQIDIRTDDGTVAHLPSATVLASVTITDPTAGSMRLVNFPSLPALSSGDLYHLVFSNPSPDPVNNFVSIDDLHTSIVSGSPQPAASLADLAVLYTQQNVPWTVNPQHVPIFSLYFADGYRQGQTYMDVSASTGVVLASNSTVEELFTVQDADHLATSVSVRVVPLIANSGLNLTLASGDTVLMSSSAIVSSAVNAPVWVTFPLPAAQPLNKGQKYFLTLSSTIPSGLKIQPIENGSAYGFLNSPAYGPSSCLYESGSALASCVGSAPRDVPFYISLSY